MYKFYEFFNPVLEVMKDGSTYSRTKIYENVATFLKLSDEQKSQTIKIGRPTYIDRTQWAMTYLKHAGALSNEKRGEWTVTKRGLDLIKSKTAITLETLQQFPEFLAFQNKKGTRKKTSDAHANASLDGYTPTELIDIALEQLTGEIQQNLNDILKSVNPYKFEHICKDLLVAMGYGGNLEELSYVTSKSGDGGIDAVIKQDPLGINTIYVQAKRYDGEVREKDIRDFLGALAQKATQNGVFITTGSFANSAKEALKMASNMNIVAIGGEELSKLMVQYKVGVEEKNRYSTYHIDSEYFEE